MDYLLFKAINDLAGRWPWLDGFMRLVVNEYFVPTSMALILAIMWFWGKNEGERARYHRIVILTVLSLITANLILKGINLLYFRPRPFDTHQVNLLFYKPWDSSFPSNPATTGFSIAVAVALNDPVWGIPFLILAVLLGFSRIFCGVHYPSDVLAGALLGAATAWFYWKFSYRFDRFVAFIRRFLKRFCLA
ncbi:MAG: phosphatase PAP2 family protein [Anaerolineae bacterium]|nr:phosphatase PAP2 family protein [Anaerolineae bacterium]MDW8102406.1 phosphatase PAP2 family protein [Anaerolineae bacterium]